MITGTDVVITSSYDGGPIQTADVTVGTPDSLGGSIEIPGGTFAWMSEPNDYVDLYAGSDGYNVLRVNFDSAANFSSNDDIAMTLTLQPGWTFGGTALTKAIDVTVPSASQTDDTLTFDLQGLDQINGFGGDAEFTFAAVAPTPEPSTLALIGLGAGFLGLLRRPRK